jgi:hypothetical protein
MDMDILFDRWTFPKSLFILLKFTLYWALRVSRATNHHLLSYRDQLHVTVATQYHCSTNLNKIRPELN